jgi:RNA polymerase sigma-70 factor, ECF subfamily
MRALAVQEVADVAAEAEALFGGQQELLDRCLAGDARAWAALHGRYRPQALAFLRRLGVGPREAEDACQEVFLQVVRYLPRFERRADFRTWLYKLCISQAQRTRRARWRRLVQVPLAWLGHRREPQAAAAGCSPGRAAALCEAALAALSLGHRSVFVLYELEGLGTAEIAALLECPAATVRRRLHEARRSFERFVGEAPFDPRGRLR